MPTCDDVRRALAGLATGEKPTPEMREHLAACDACRAARDVMNAEVAGVREGFASLSPSPFLEEAVIASAQRGAEEASARRPWAYVAIAAVAAAALFLVVILPQLESTPEPVVVEEQPGEDDEATPAGPGIEIPPSQGQVEAARKINAIHTDLGEWPLEPGQRMHKSVSRRGHLGMAPSDGFLPIDPDAHHRYVYGDAAAQPGYRVHVVHRWPAEPGIVLLGRGFVEEIGAELVPGGDWTIYLEGKRWRTTRGTVEGEILLGSPDPRGAKARVRVLVDRNYPGTLLVEGPLARALGLHQFEVPGGVRFHAHDGAPTGPTGRRARARVRVPELGVDRVMEVQTVRDRPWQTKGGGSDDEPVAVLEGASPSHMVWARTIRLTREGFTARGGGMMQREVEFHKPLGAEESFGVPLGEGVWQIAMHYEPRPALPQIPDTPLLGELFRGGWSIVVLRTLDCPVGALHGIQAKWVKLDGTWEPGAGVTISRAWRGAVALPSREAVVRTSVRQDGSIAFVRVAGEPGATLRMLVTKADGTSTFHDVVVSPDELSEPRIPVALTAGGVVKLPGWEARLVAPPGGEPLRPVDQMKTLVGVRDRLQSMAGSLGFREKDGTSPFVLSLQVDPDVRWQYVQWLMQIAAEPTIALAKIRMALPGSVESGERIDLPLDRGIQLGVPLVDDEAPMVTIKLFVRGPEETLAIRVGNEEVTRDQVVPALRALIARIGKDPAEVKGELKTPRPKGLRVRFADALAMVRAFREVGIQDVQFEGAPAPIPVQGQPPR